MSYWKITKSYRNACDVYYIELPLGENKVTEEMLESIGANTEGGHRYGFEMTATKVRRLPKNAKLLSRERTISIF